MNVREVFHIVSGRFKQYMITVVQMTSSLSWLENSRKQYKSLAFQTKEYMNNLTHNLSCSSGFLNTYASSMECCCLVTGSCLICKPMDQAISPVHGISQVRSLEWLLFLLQRESLTPDPGAVELSVSHCGFSTTGKGYREEPTKRIVS